MYFADPEYPAFHDASMLNAPDIGSIRTTCCSSYAVGGAAHNPSPASPTMPESPSVSKTWTTLALSGTCQTGFASGPRSIHTTPTSRTGRGWAFIQTSSPDATIHFANPSLAKWKTALAWVPPGVTRYSASGELVWPDAAIHSPSSL